jgi:hypothetical protein
MPAKTKTPKTPKPAKSETPAAETPTPEPSPVFVLPAIPTAHEPLLVDIKKLVTDLGTQPRVQIDPGLVAEYAEQIKAAKSADKPYPLPPISCVRTPEGKIIPYDGFHRIMANKGLHSEIVADCVDGDEQLAIILSLGANATHGSRRTTKDKQNAVKRAFKDDNLATLSDSAIAELCAVSVSMVKDHRPAAKSTGVRVSKAGKKINTSGIGKKGGAAPKKKKSAAATNADPSPATNGATDAKKQTAANERLSIVLARVEKAIGGVKGVEFREGIIGGTIELNLKELTELSGFNPETIQAILPLITNAQMKPGKAKDFYKSDPPEKVIEDLALRMICAGGLFVFEHAAVKITAETPTPQPAAA